MEKNDLTRIEGPSLALRLIQPEDAQFLFDLRTDKTYNKHLSLVTGTVEDQRNWIKAYKQREAAGLEYYYVIERHDGIHCGTVRLYDIADGQFTWGSWILNQNKPPKAALESACLVYEVAFGALECSEARFDVRRHNHNTLGFHRRFGAMETHADEQDVFFVYSRTQFIVDRDQYLEILHKGVPT